MKETLAKRLNDALQESNMSQIDISNATGIPKSSISQYCAGKKVPRQKRIYLLASVLGVSEAWLMGYDVPKSKTIAPTIDQTAGAMWTVLNNNLGRTPTESELAKFKEFSELFINSLNKNE